MRSGAIRSFGCRVLDDAKHLARNRSRLSKDRFDEDGCMVAPDCALLSAQSQALDHFLVAPEFLDFQVIEQTPTLANHLQEAAA